jgi:hypothetical protein
VDAEEAGVLPSKHDFKFVLASSFDFVFLRQIKCPSFLSSICTLAAQSFFASKSSGLASTGWVQGYLVEDHYYFSELEKQHYYSRILKFAIAILNFP